VFSHDKITKSAAKVQLIIENPGANPLPTFELMHFVISGLQNGDKGVFCVEM
jgi:hypothetical protein